jgi:CO/xanthine dehydrogenase Mo-binding subunit
VGLPEEQVVIEPVAIGSDFGGKGLTVDELPCYFLSRATGRPVRYTSTSTEELRRGPTRHAATVTLRSVVDADGRLLAHHSDVRYDGGAYAATKPIPNLLPGNAYGSIPYRVPNVRLDITGVYTNALPAAHVRGPGELQTFSAWELHVDRIAREDVYHALQKALA